MIIIIIIILLTIFSHECSLMIFRLSPRDNKSFQASRTFLSILARLNNAVVWRVLNLPPITNTSSNLKPYDDLQNISIGLKYAKPYICTQMCDCY